MLNSESEEITTTKEAIDLLSDDEEEQMKEIP